MQEIFLQWKHVYEKEGSSREIELYSKLLQYHTDWMVKLYKFEEESEEEKRLAYHE